MTDAPRLEPPLTVAYVLPLLEYAGSPRVTRRRRDELKAAFTRLHPLPDGGLDRELVTGAYSAGYHAIIEHTSGLVYLPGEDPMMRAWAYYESVGVIGVLEHWLCTGALNAILAANPLLCRLVLAMSDPDRRIDESLVRRPGPTG